MKRREFLKLGAIATGTLVIVLTALLTAGTLPAQEKVGKVSFPTSCSAAVQPEFERAVAMLHSFWFSPSVNAFSAVAQRDPGCGMAHWGIAMNLLGNPFAWPPAPKALADGWAAVEKAKSSGDKTQRERDYIAAIEAFYKDAATVDHRTRALAYLQAMERLTQRYPDDREAAIFHALALNATALPTDKTYANQLKAAGILEKVFAEQPEHPGVAHYLIHSYDYPPIADKGVAAARRYAGIAPSAPHALHMPSHIFTRRGYWQDSVDSNRASAEAAKGDNFNQFHAMDYLAYAHLQMAQDQAAKRVLDGLNATGKIQMEHFVSGFALATIPSRYALERGRWSEAAALTLYGNEFPWARFPQSEAQLVFARGLGAARSGNATAARKDIDRLQALRDALTAAKQGYWAEQTEIQRLIVSAWATRAEGKLPEAFQLLRAAVEREDATEKHPVTPGPLAPARELLGDMLLEASRPAEALKEFEATMRMEPNRFRTVAGAARAAELAGDKAKARSYYAQLVALTEKADSERPEVKQAKAFLGK